MSKFGQRTTLPLRYRVWIDVPVSLNKEPGYAKAVACWDFQEQPVGFFGPYTNTERDPVSKAVTLASTIGDPSRWLDPTYWIPADLYALPPGYLRGVRTHYDLPVVGRVVNEPLSRRTLTDTLPPPAGFVWEVRTPSLETNEGFAVYWFTSADDVGVGRGEIAIGFGLSYCFTLNRKGKFVFFRFESGQWRVVWEQNLPTPPVSSSSWVIVVRPLSGVGITVYLLGIGPNQRRQHEHLSTQTGPGAVVWVPEEDMGGWYKVTDPSPVRIGFRDVDPAPVADVVGVHRIRYASTSGHYTDAPWDPYYQPTVSPSALPYWRAMYPGQSVGVTLWDIYGVNTYTVPDHRVGRTRVHLTTPSTQWTPVVTGYLVSFPQVPHPRTTTPVLLADMTSTTSKDVLTELTMRISRSGGISGEFSAIVRTPEVLTRLVRGDGTLRVERSVDGTTWTEVTTGFYFNVTFEPGEGAQFHRVRARFRDLWHRLAEHFFLSETAFDGRTVAEAVDYILRYSGFSGLADAAPVATTVTFPPRPDNVQWRYGPRAGSTAEDIIQLLLRFLHAADPQGREFALDYIPGTGWVLRQRQPGDLWRFSLTTDPTKPEWWFAIKRIVVRPEPPEGTHFLVASLTEPQEGVPAKDTFCAINSRALLDPTYIGYLGRYKMVVFLTPEFPEEEVAERLARRIANVAGVPRRVVDAQLVWTFQTNIPRVDDRVVLYYRPPFVDTNRYFDQTQWPELYVREVEVTVRPNERSVNVLLDSLWQEVTHV